jgi:hypothetical protein
MFLLIRKIRGLINSDYSIAREVSHEDLSLKLDSLITSHQEVILAARMTTARPSLRAKRVAWVIFLTALLFISVATVAIVFISSANGQAEGLREQAQAERSQATEQLVEALAPFSQGITTQLLNKPGHFPFAFDKSFLTIIGMAEKLERNADALDLQADHLTNTSTPSLYFWNMLLVLGSTVAGGVISWAVAQALIDRRTTINAAQAGHSHVT